MLSRRTERELDRLVAGFASGLRLVVMGAKPGILAKGRVLEPSRHIAVQAGLGRRVGGTIARSPPPTCSLARGALAPAQSARGRVRPSGENAAALYRWRSGSTAAWHRGKDDLLPTHRSVVRQMGQPVPERRDIPAP